MFSTKHICISNSPVKTPLCPKCGSLTRVFHFHIFRCLLSLCSLFLPLEHFSFDLRYLGGSQPFCGGADGPKDACLGLGSSRWKAWFKGPSWRVKGGACAGGPLGPSKVHGVSRWALGTWVPIMILYILYICYAYMKLFMIL